MPSAASAEPASAPFETITGTCTGGTLQHWSGLPLPGSHSPVMARYVVEKGSVQKLYFPALTGEDNEQYLGQSVNVAHAGEVYWGDAPKFAAGETPEVWSECSTAATFTVYLYNVEMAPVSFTGVSYLDPSLSFSQQSEEELPFTVRAVAPYVANVSLASGGVEVHGSRLTSSGTVSLGTLSPQAYRLRVLSLEGPEAQWTVSINPVPIVVSGVGFSPTLAKQGAADTLGYSLDGDSTITATVANSSGVVVRSLASSLPVPYRSEPYTLTWDGRDGNGNPVPDGVYTATVTSVDPFGNVSSAQAAITLDSTPPTISVQSATIGQNQALLVNFADNLSGVVTGSVLAVGHLLELAPGQTQLSYIPPAGGWELGHHEISAAATDRAGNERKATLAFNVVAPRCRVPLLRHKTIGQARQLLSRAHCRLGKVYAARHHSHKYIGSQKPAAKKVVANGTRVNVTLG